MQEEIQEEILVYKNLIGGQFLLQKGNGVLTIINQEIKNEKKSLFILEAVTKSGLRIKQIGLLPKVKSDHVLIEEKLITLDALQELSRNKSICQSWQLNFDKLGIFEEILVKQKAYHVEYKKHGEKIAYYCRSWDLPENPRTEIDWCTEILANLGLTLGRWETFKLDKTSATKIISEPTASIGLPNTTVSFFSSTAEENVETYCHLGERQLSQQNYEAAFNHFEQALRLEATHRLSQQGYQKAAIALGIAAYNRNAFEQAQQYFRKVLAIEPHHAFAEEGLTLSQRHLGLAPALDSAPTTPKHFPFPIENAVFQGGGIKGIAYIGSLSELLTAHYDFNLAQLQRVGGTSAGAITALILGLGYTLEEANEILANTHFTDFFDGPYQEAFIQLNQREAELTQKFKAALQGNPVGIVSNAASLYASDQDVALMKQGLALLAEEDFGLFKGERIRQWIEELIRVKTGGEKQPDGRIDGGIADATFRELHALRENDPVRYGKFKAMYFVGVNLTLSQVEVFSYEHTPDVIISDAVRISMSLPLIFKAHRLYIKNQETAFQPQPDPKGHWYADGGLLSNQPGWLFDHSRYMSTSSHAGFQHNPHTLVFALTSTQKKAYYEGGEKPVHAQPHGLFSYLKQVIECIYENREREIPGQAHSERVIYIDNKGIKATEFALTPLQRDRLKYAGEKAVQDYFARIAKVPFDHFIVPTIHPQYFTYLNPQHKDENGNTLLHIAIQQADITLIHYLCTYKMEEIHKAAKNNDGQTVWDLAQTLHHPYQPQISQLLQTQGFNIAPQASVLRTVI